MYDFDTVIERRGSGCTKWDALEERFGEADLLPLWIADMDFPAPPCVVTAVRERAAHPIYGYATFVPDYHDGFVAWQKKRHGWDVKPEWLCHTPGVVSAISMALQGFTAPGDGVLILSPTYPPFRGTAEALGRKVITSSLRLENGRFEIDFDDLRAKAKEARVLLFCNPHNPTGRCFSRTELDNVEAIAREAGLPVICDEIHADIVYGGHRHIPFASLSDWAQEHSLILMAPSKTFNIAGLATSVNVVPSDRLRAQFRRLTDDCTHIGGGNVFGLVACRAAFAGGEAWLDELLAYLEGNVAFVEAELARRVPQVELVRPEATYMPLVDFRSLGMENERLQRFLIDTARVALNDGASFGVESRGFARLNIATPRVHLAEFIDRLERALRA